MAELPTVSSTLVNLRIQAARNFGVDPVEVYRHANVDGAIFELADEKITIVQENAVWRAIVDASGDEHIGLRIGQNFQLSALGVLGYVLMNAGTLGECLRKFCAYEHVIANTYHHNLSLDNNQLAYEMHVTDCWYPERKYTLDLSMIAVRKVAAELTGNAVEPVRVQFQFDRPADVSAYESAFSPAPVDFACDHSGIFFDKEIADLPIIGSNPEMFAGFERQAAALLRHEQSRQSYAFKVKQLIVEALKGETPTSESTADRLAMSVRNLQLKLKAEGTSFQKILDEVRRDIAISYLNSRSATKSEIAYLVGFAEVSVFSKAFKKWTGQTPSEFQQALDSCQ